MGESGVLLDRRGSPVTPFIAWHDTRDRGDTNDLVDAIGHDVFAGRTGLPPRPQWSLTKHRWLVRCHPGAADASRRLGVAEWIVKGLGGDEASEQSLASRTGWLDLATRTWWHDTLEWSGASPDLLPPLTHCGDRLGRASAGSGIPALAGAALTVAGHDHQAAAIGVDAAGAGDELDSCGTAEALVRTLTPGLAVDEVRALTGAGFTVGWHALPDRWCLLGATQGGLTLQRVLAMLGADRAAIVDLDRAASLVSAGPLRISGADTGDVNILHITDNNLSPAHVWRAALDAVATEAGLVHDGMSAVVGAHRRLVVTGGWSHSAGVLAAKRSRLGDFRIARVGEAGARGAALFAGLSAGIYASPAEFPIPIESARPVAGGADTVHPIN
jgi:sugar (pentulose or hexulose) kinase